MTYGTDNATPCPECAGTIFSYHLCACEHCPGIIARCEGCHASTSFYAPAAYGAPSARDIRMAHAAAVESVRRDRGDA